MTQLDRIEQRLEKIERMINGNGDPGKSINVRLALVTQFIKTRRWIEKTVIASILGLIIWEILG